MNTWGIPFSISLVLHLGLLSMVSILSPDIKHSQLKPILVKVSQLPVHVEPKPEPILNPPAKLTPPPPKEEEPPQEMKKPPPPPKEEAKELPKEIKKPPTEDIQLPKPLPVAEKETTLNETEQEPIPPDLIPPDRNEDKMEEETNIQATGYTGDDKSSLSPVGVGNESGITSDSTGDGEDGLGEGPGRGNGPKKGKGFPGWLKGTGPGIDFGDNINSSNKYIGRVGGGGDKDKINLGGDKGKKDLGVKLEDRERRGTGPLAHPKYSENPKPVYPPEAIKEGNEGTVLLLVEVLPNGRVGEIEVAKSSGYEMLDQSALTTVKRWQFIPAKKGGAPFTCRVRIPVVFRLQ
jgi:TonB family protein